jgi:hypothetical protein
VSVPESLVKARFLNFTGMTNTFVLSAVHNVIPPSNCPKFFSVPALS